MNVKCEYNEPVIKLSLFTYLDSAFFLSRAPIRWQIQIEWTPTNLKVRVGFLLFTHKYAMSYISYDSIHFKQFFSLQNIDLSPSFRTIVYFNFHSVHCSPNTKYKMLQRSGWIISANSHFASAFRIGRFFFETDQHLNNNKKQWAMTNEVLDEKKITRKMSNTKYTIFNLTKITCNSMALWSLYEPQHAPPFPGKMTVAL